MPLSLSAVGFVTRDREASLVASLRSYLDNCRRHARTPEFIVVDGSNREDSGETVRAALSALPRSKGEVIRYAGLVEKRRFGAELARESSVDRDIVDFALFGDARCRRTTGANRNALLLDTIDALVFSADDDTVCRTAAAPEPQASVAITSDYDPTAFWFFPDRRRALEAAPEGGADPLDDHERFLGRTVADLAGMADAAGEVTITLHGLVGDSGMGAPRYFLSLDGASRERLLASEEAYRSALRSREVLRTVSRPTLAASAFCMTPFYGFDNRRLLPPFFPVERNSDGVFGLMVHKYVAGSRVAFLPSVLLHAPQEHRSFADGAASADAASVRIADVLIAVIQAHKLTSMEEGDDVRLARLGSFLGDLASLETDDFARVAGTTQQLRTLAATALLEQRLREHAGAPGFWADDVKKTIETLRGTAANGDYIVPRDLSEGRDRHSALELARELVMKYGELLDAWPVLVESARRLKARDCRVSEPVD
jgi:hypothetical protein